MINWIKSLFVKPLSELEEGVEEEYSNNSDTYEMIVTNDGITLLANDGDTNSNLVFTSTQDLLDYVTSSGIKVSFNNLSLQQTTLLYELTYIVLVSQQEKH